MQCEPQQSDCLIQTCALPGTFGSHEMLTAGLLPPGVNTRKSALDVLSKSAQSIVLSYVSRSSTETWATSPERAVPGHAMTRVLSALNLKEAVTFTDSVAPWPRAVPSILTVRT